MRKKFALVCIILCLPLLLSGCAGIASKSLANYLDNHNPDPKTKKYIEQKYNKKFEVYGPRDNETGISVYYYPEGHPEELCYARRYRTSEKKNKWVYEDTYLYYLLRDDFNAYARQLCADVFPDDTCFIFVGDIGDTTQLPADATMQDVLNFQPYENGYIGSKNRISVLLAVKIENGHYNAEDFRAGVDKAIALWQQESIKYNHMIYLQVCAVTPDIYDQFNDKLVLSQSALAETPTEISDILKYGLTNRTDTDDPDYEQWDPFRNRLQYYYEASIYPDQIKVQTPKKFQD